MVAVVGLTACGGDDSGTEGAPSDTAAPNDDDGSQVVGLSVIAAEAGDSGATPQCAYTYERDAGGQSNLDRVSTSGSCPPTATSSP